MPSPSRFEINSLDSGSSGPGARFSKDPVLNLTRPKSDFDMKVSRKAGCVLTSDEVHFVSLAANLTVQFSNLLKPPLEWKTKQLNGPGNYRELRETGPWFGKPLGGKINPTKDGEKHA